MHFASFNVNGIREVQKRRGVFKYLKEFNTDVILLQETHSVREDEIVWSNEWGRKIYFNHGTSNSRGVAVLFNKKVPVVVENVSVDAEGRYMIMDLNLNDYQFIMVNVYAPNEDDPSFFVRLFEQIETCENNSIIMGGDFNTSLDESKDLYNHKGTNHSRKREVINQYLEQKGLIDIWRVQHQESRMFTWRKPNVNQLIMSRLDHFFISEDFSNRTIKTEIRPKYKSDHSRITLHLDLAESKRGRGFWKFNNLHLKDPSFLELMNKTILEALWAVPKQNEHPSDTR